MQIAYRLLYFYCTCFAWLYGGKGALKQGDLFAIHIKHLGKEGKLTGLTILVAHLRFSMNGGLVTWNVEIGSIDIGTCGAQIAIQRQGLVKLVGNVQEHVLGYAAIVGIKVTVVPLVTTVVLARTVGPAVIATYGNGVAAFLDVRSEIETTGHHAILAKTKMLSVQIKIGALAHTFELNKHFLVGNIRQLESFAIPTDGVGQVHNVFLKGLIAIKSIGQGNPCPTCIVEIGPRCLLHIANSQSPTAVEILFCALGCLGICTA